MKKKLESVLMISFLLIQTFAGISQFAFDNNRIEDGLLYVSDNGNSFVIREKADFKLSVDLLNGWDAYINGKVGYSPISNIYTSVSLLIVRPGGLIGGYNPEINMGDVGIGFYYFKEVSNLFKQKPKWMMQKKGWLVNALLGYSRGKIQHKKVGVISGVGEFDLNRFYGQMGIDYQNGLCGFAASAKLGVLNYRDVTLRGDASVDLIDRANLLMEKNNFVFGEINFRFYVGIKVGQIYSNLILTKVPVLLSEYSDRSYGTLGVVLNIQEFFKKKNKDEK